MRPVGHRESVLLQDRVDAIEVGDVHRDQGVDQRVVGQPDGGAPPQPPHELPVGVLVGDTDVEFVQRK